MKKKADSLKKVSANGRTKYLCKCKKEEAGRSLNETKGHSKTTSRFTHKHG
ncbi:hypothetical protein HMPREF1146_2429 [Prevotella sp. MSX73]|nr:hypothetical protein HMPREF0649_01665 [Segatella buccae D17]EJP27900.1 hypothetical protein HMPREF1146_2429 [Prevotella sp. MSX73]